jgi:hypothetical protein
MNNDPETADGSRVMTLGGHVIRSTFPRHWGKPPDDIAEREAWMRRNIREGEERMNHGERVEGQRPRTGRQAMAALNRKRTSSADANHIRLQMLERNKLGPQ